MKRKKVLFFSCEPGGAEVLIPVIALLRTLPQFEVIVLAYGYALERFIRNKINHIVIEPVIQEGSSILDFYAPDILITSATSLPSVDMSEKFLWSQASRRKIPSIGFIDQWQNYAIRFSGQEAKDRLAFQPLWINCLNHIGRMEMVGHGFDNDKLLEFGHPYLSSVKRNLATIEVEKLRRDLRIRQDCSVILFVSEALRENYGLKYGYDQYTALEFFLENLKNSREPLEILVKLHPKDSESNFADIATRYRHLSLRFIKNNVSSLECIALSDYVFGMRSIMLIEAYIGQKERIASIQPGLCSKDEDGMVLSRHHLIPLIHRREDQNLLGLAWGGGLTFDVEFRATEFLYFINHVI